MIGRLFTGLSILTTLAAGVSLPAEAQPAAAAANEAVPPRCREIEYSAPSPGSAPVAVERLEGQAVFAPVGSRYELSGANGVCLALFREGEEKPVALGTTDEGGRFAFLRPEPGTYVLVATFEPVHDLTVALRMSDAPPPSAGDRGLLLHLRATEDERRSFASVLRHLGLRRELLEMRRLDQEVRNAWIHAGVTTPRPEILSRMAEIDARHTTRLQAIVEQHGWPGSDLVGLDGAEGAFLVLQHASHAVQKELFPLVEAAYGAGTVSGQSYALLLDRIRVGDGRPQVYGSQARPFAEWIDGEPALEPIEDEANVDERRAEVGLPPLAEYRELLKSIYLSER